MIYFLYYKLVSLNRKYNLDLKSLKQDYNI